MSLVLQWRRLLLTQNGVATLIRHRRPWCSTLLVPLSTVLLISIGFGIEAKAQNAQQATDSAITELVESIAKPLKKANAKKVIVFDFRGPNEQLHPAGKWLADQVSVTIRKEFPKIEAIDRSLLSPNKAIAETPTDAHAIFAAEISQARSLGADAIITGTFARVSDQIGVSLSIANMADMEKTQDVRTRLVPISQVITDLTPEPIPGLDLQNGIPRGGVGGITMPICTRCPAPEFPRNAREGDVVLLEIVVTPEGRPERIKIIKSPNPDVADSAVRTVRSWRFKPAIGFDGSPLAVFTPIQVTFRRK
jgi:TonB family protein